MSQSGGQLTDDSYKVRELNHYQFSYVAGSSTEPGTFTLQLVLDEGAWEEVLSLNADDAEVLQNLLRKANNVHYDVNRRVLMLGNERVGEKD